MRRGRFALRCEYFRPKGTEELEIRGEIKNVSPLTAIERAIKFESRHIDALKKHTETLIQETRCWCDIKGRTFAMRNKETAADCMYFTDPNLMPIMVGDEWFARIKECMPAFIEEKRLENTKWVCPLRISTLAFQRRSSATCSMPL